MNSLIGAMTMPRHAKGHALMRRALNKKRRPEAALLKNFRPLKVY
jgi:hypothetical protein